MRQRRLGVAFLTVLVVLGMGLLAPRVWGQTRVSVAQSQDLLAFAPAYIARAKHFKEAGIEAQFEVLSGDSVVATSVTGGSPPFGLGSLPGMFNNAGERG